MMEVFNLNIRRKVLSLLASLIITVSLAGLVYGQVVINVLAVNGTEETREKEIREVLPKELTSEDVLDTAGLKLEYDITRRAYVLTGRVALGPKETKTYKVRVRDVWRVEPEEIEEIKTQIDQSLDHIKETKYYPTAVERKKELVHRLDYIVQEHQDLEDNVQKRIDHYRTYAKEIKKIRDRAVSVSYWRDKPLPQKEEKIVKFVVEVENPLDTVKTVKQEHYLPSEVKPEHVIDSQGFDIRYDVATSQSFLFKEEDFQPKEKKKYVITLKDIWHIPQQKIENLKDRTRETYALLEKTKYKETADFLVENIKKHLLSIEDSQKVDRPIKEHISAYRVNKDRFDLAKKDVEALEDLLRAVREKLERSMLKNVLQKVKQLKSLADISKALIKKPTLDLMWKIILGIVTFVGLVTIVHFSIWGKRSKGVKEEELEEKGQKEDDPKA